MSGQRRVALGLAILWTTVVCFLALTSSRTVRGLPDMLGKPAQHFISFAVIAALLGIAFPGRLRLVALWLTVGGVVGELLQLLTESRQFDLVDIAMDIAGIGVGILLVALFTGEAAAVPVIGSAVAVLAATPFVLVVDAPAETSFPDECTSAPAAVGGEPVMLVDRRPASGQPPALDPSVDELRQALLATNEWAVELWFETPDLQQTGPARIFTISDGIQPDEFNLHTGVSGAALSVRLRTSCEWSNVILVADVIEVGRPQHAIVNWSAGVAKTWVDGVLVDETRLPWGDLAGWDPDFQYSIGDEIGGMRKFDGTVLSVTMWDRALDEPTIAARSAAPPP